MQSTTKDVILLCKGYYNKENYPTVLDALKEYYRKYGGSCLTKDFLDETFLNEALLSEVLNGIATRYPDRLHTLVTTTLVSPADSILLPDSNNNDYGYQVFWRIVGFLKAVPLRGEGLMEIDVSDYLTVNIAEDGTKHLELIREII